MFGRFAQKAGDNKGSVSREVQSDDGVEETVAACATVCCAQVGMRQFWIAA